MRTLKEISAALRTSGSAWAPAVGMALAIVGFILAASTLVTTTGCGGESETSTAATSAAGTTTSARPAATSKTPTKTSAYNFGEETKPDHYVRAIPGQGAIMPAPPLKISVTFDTNLAQSSQITITSSGQDYGSGAAEISETKLSQALDPAAPDGLYTVEYKACWQDGGCQDGSFKFAIESTPGHVGS